ncbi:MAG: hypothetical protein Ta2A_01910 [Treponemataceae bacterium]|nr:MAG: hypothetical protein Ta2A_01910 [Treponemataceae bacterium]
MFRVGETLQTAARQNQPRQPHPASITRRDSQNQPAQHGCCATPSGRVCYANSWAHGRAVDIPRAFCYICIMTQNMFYNDDEDDDEDAKKKAAAALAEARDPFGEKFMKTRQILLSGEINKELAEKIVRQLLVFEADSDEPVRIFIDSPGGDADAGYAIFDMIRFIHAPVYNIGMGLVASAAALILLAVPKERRIALPNSHYLIHQPLSSIKGVATDIEIHAQELEKMRTKINQLISDETGKAVDLVKQDTNRDFWMNAEEAVSYGLIGKIAAKRADIREKR